MRLKSFEAIIRALNDADVRYLIAGGLAVNAHGYLRFTKDVDLVLAMEPENILHAFQALEELGYRPQVPVTAEGFADASQRRQWVEEKGMKVLGFFSDLHPETTIDIFVTEPFAFDAEYQTALRGEVLPDMEAGFVSIPTLMEMKRQAARPNDLDDIKHLRMILEEQEKASDE